MLQARLSCGAMAPVACRQYVTASWRMLKVPLTVKHGRTQTHFPPLCSSGSDVHQGTVPSPAQTASGDVSGNTLAASPLSSNEFLQSLEAPLTRTDAGQDSRDITRVGGVIAVVATTAFAVELNKGWIADHQELSMSTVFLAGYISIIVEEALGLSKAGVALLMAAALWAVRATEGPQVMDVEMSAALSEVSQIIFFLLGAATIVEVVDSHQGFKIITQRMRPRSRPELLVSVSVLTFFMSSVLDNLTTTIVMVSLLQKLCPDPDTRRFLGAAVVVAANAGGAWTPIGDVTTTMLWIHGQISTVPTMRDLLLPSIVSVALPVAAWALTAPEMKGEASTGGATGGAAAALEAAAASTSEGDALTQQEPLPAPRGSLVLSIGLGSLMMVPVLRTWAGMPPFLAVLAGLGFLWLLTDAIHFGEKGSPLTVPQALKRIDSEGVLFFTGVLLAVGALDQAGLLRELAQALSSVVSQQEVVAGLIGLVSAVVDNVPLVAATMGMYGLDQHPMDDGLWQLTAYCAGTGGSLLIIGSASGVAYMGMVKGAGFGWYAARITPWALAGYAAGMGTYIVQQNVMTALGS